MTVQFPFSKLWNQIGVSNRNILSHKLTSEVLTPQKTAYDWFCSFLIAKFSYLNGYKSEKFRASISKFIIIKEKKNQFKMMLDP
jgi:hypothetical protein